MSISETTKGNGWAATSIDALGGGLGFHKIRPEIDVTEYGINCITLPPRFQTGIHWHEQQQETYFVHSGTVVFHFGAGAEPDETIEASAGSFVNVEASTPRRIRNESQEPATYVIVGGKGGYIGRDGKAPEGEAAGAAGGGPLD